MSDKFGMPLVDPINYKEAFKNLTAENAALKAELLQTKQRLQGAVENVGRFRDELEALKAQEPVGEIQIYTGSGELRGNKWSIAAPFPTVVWADGKQPPVGTKLFTAPQPAVQWEHAKFVQRVLEAGNAATEKDRADAYWMVKEFRQMTHEVAVSETKQPAAVPDGWKMVPVEPTSRMLGSALNSDKDGAPASYTKIYLSMLAAAPEAPQASQDTKPK